MYIVIILQIGYAYITVTRLLSHVEQELLTIPEHLSSPPVFSDVRVARSLIFCVVICRWLFVLFTFLFAIVLSVLLRFTASEYTFGILKLFYVE